MRAGVILLAAGSSSRMGQSKQLLKVGGESLLVRTTTIALETGLQPVVVVLGANEREHRKAIEHLGVPIAENSGWQLGMGSSLKTGLKHLLSIAPGTDAVLVLVCDQPLLTTIHLRNILEQFRVFNPLIVASRYAGNGAVPAVFHKDLFPKILEMEDAQGAKKIIGQHSNDTIMVDFPDGSVDLDTPEDFQKFTGSQS